MTGQIYCTFSQYSNFDVLVITSSESYCVVVRPCSGATKGALDMLTKVMALELGPHQVLLHSNLQEGFAKGAQPQSVLNTRTVPENSS